MCQFFSFVSDGNGKYFYSDWDARREYRSGKKTGLADSHTSIAHYAGYSGAAEDKLNKYEYNPITKCFRVDQINAKNDQGAAKDFCEALDFSTIVPALRIKPITNPLKLNRKRVTKKDVALLKKWDSVRDSVRASVRASVWDSVRASVWASVWAYAGSFLNLPRNAWKYTENIKTKKYPFHPLADLWEMGIVPSFDGKKWRLHAGKDAKIIFETSEEKLMEK